jgi:hypothetical protein
MRLRREGRPKDKTVYITIFNNNPNVFNGKRASLDKLPDVVKPTVATFQETAVAKSNKKKYNKILLFTKQ